MKSPDEECRDNLQEAIKELERLSAPPHKAATICEVGKTILLSTGIYSQPHPKLSLKVGDTVAVTDRGQIVEKIQAPHNGDKGIVMSADDKVVTVAIKGGESACYTAMPVDIGDEVILNNENNVIIRKLPAPKRMLSYKPNVRWDQIIGNSEAKQVLAEVVGADKARLKLMAHYKKKPISGVLLYGPPGNGKTMLAKALATEMSDAQFISIKGPEILSEYVGLAEAAVRSVFHRARKHKEETGQRSVIFIDEADAILGSRDDSRFGIEKTIVPAFLAEMDGLETSSAFVVLATNLPNTLDSAIIRDGRIDRKIRVPRPSMEDAEQIVSANLLDIPCATGLTDIIKTTVSEVFNKNRTLALVSYSNGEADTICFKDAISGAMIASLIERASFTAIERDMKTGKRSGIAVTDVIAAVDSMHHENKAVDLRGIAMEMANGRSVINIHPITA